MLLNIIKIHFCVPFLLLKFIGTVSAVSPYDLTTASIIPSHVITELPIILFKYLSISQADVLGFQT